MWTSTLVVLVLNMKRYLLLFAFTMSFNIFSKNVKVLWEEREGTDTMYQAVCISYGSDKSFHYGSVWINVYFAVDRHPDTKLFYRELISSTPQYSYASGVETRQVPVQCQYPVQ